MSIPYQGTADPTHQAPEGTLFLRTDTNTVFRNTDGGTTWIAMIDDDDARLSDSRPPDPHTHTLADVTDSGALAAKNSVATADIDANAVTNAELAQMAANTVKGNNTGAPADPVDLTQAQITALINAFTDLLSGVVPASGGGTANFLRADGTWNVPPGSGGSPVEASAVDETQDSKSSTSFGSAVLNLNHNFPAGDYVIVTYYEINTNSTGKVVDAKIEVDSTEEGEHHVDVGTVANEMDGKAMMKKMALSGVHDIDIFYRLNPATTGATARIRRKRIAVFRV